MNFMRETEQYYDWLYKIVCGEWVRVALLTGGMKAAARRTTLAAIRSDEADLVVGTHAILSEGVEFARLGLAVVHVPAYNDASAAYCHMQESVRNRSP